MRLFFLVCLLSLCGCASSLVADVEETPEARLKPQPGFEGRDIEVETWPVWLAPEGDPKRRVLGVYVDFKAWPQSRYKLERAILRIRLRSASILNDDDEPACSWRPQICTIVKGLKIDAINGGEPGKRVRGARALTAYLKDGRLARGEVSFKPREIWSAPHRFINVSNDVRGALQGVPGSAYLEQRVGNSIRGVDVGEPGKTYLELLDSWNESSEVSVKQNGLWLEILFTGPMVKNRLERGCVVMLDGPVTVRHDEHESYFLNNFASEHLRPHVHLIMTKKRR